MSRIGVVPVDIPEGVSVFLKRKTILIKGPLGELSQNIYINIINIEIKNNKIYLYNLSNKKEYKSLHGLYRSLIFNMIVGVKNGFVKKLELVGIGYRATNNGNILELNLGYSHNIIIKTPNEINIETKNEKGKNTIIILKSFDKQLLGIIASKIRSLRKPEPYKGKGIRYLNEILRRKTGKSA